MTTLHTRWLLEFAQLDALGRAVETPTLGRQVASALFVLSHPADHDVGVRTLADLAGVVPPLSPELQDWSRGDWRQHAIKVLTAVVCGYAPPPRTAPISEAEARVFRDAWWSGRPPGTT